MLHDAYLWAESGYRQDRLLAEAEEHRLRQRARKARRSRRESVRRPGWSRLIHRAA